MPKNRFYVVWRGRQTGIFNSWDECKQQIDGYPGAQYRAYPDWEQAHEAHLKGYWKNVADKIEQADEEVEQDSVTVDVRINENGRLQYFGFHTTTGQLLFSSPVYEDGNNNVGQFLAIVHALALLAPRDDFRTIYSASDTAIRWVEKRQCNTSLCRTLRNTQLFDLLARANQWLAHNSFANHVVKWDKERWGEIAKPKTSAEESQNR